jgi:hypothetical protein
MTAEIINLRDHLSADPAFAAVRKYRAAVTAFNRYDGPEDSEQHQKLEQAFHDAQNEYLRVVPITPEGLKAKVTAWDLYCSGATEECVKSFLNTLCDAAYWIAHRAATLQ